MTIKEIAILANTSRGTVDRVINKRGKVAKDVEERVLEVIRATNYRPNEIGRSLSLSNKKITVGFIIGSIGNPFFNLVIDGIKATAEKYKNAGLKIIIEEVDLLNKKSIVKALDVLQTKNIDALAITSLNDEEIIKRINNLNIPVVTLSIDIPVNRISFVGCDYYNSGQLAGNFANLVRSNGTNIGIVIGSLSHIGQSQRLKGFKDTINENINIIEIKENLEDDSISYKVVSEMVESHEDLELVVFLGAGVDGGLQALKKYEGKIKAITVDQSKEVEKGLSSGLVLATITQHPYTQGMKTVEMLYDYLIRKRKIDSQKILDNSLILKESIIPHKLNDTNY